MRAVDTVRVLAADAVQKAGNGHPGTAMSLAPVAYLLYQNVMTHDPSDPTWLGRDRFVLSCGHSSLTQYIQLYLSGYGLELKDLKALRTWGSLTPGHPEVHHTTGVEITTGPLGSGLASAVGMAMAQRRQRGLLDPDAKPGESPFDHHVWVLASDGDLMEGVASEACSLAGHQELGNLTVVYDANQISIEDDTDISFSEDVAKRYEAYGWDVVDIDWRRSTNPPAPPTTSRTSTPSSPPSRRARSRATSRPSCACTRSSPGPPRRSGAPASRTARPSATTRSPPPRSCSASTRRRPSTSTAPSSRTPARSRSAARPPTGRGTRRTPRGARPTPTAPRCSTASSTARLPDGFEKALPAFPADAKGVATRAASGKVLGALADVMPELWGGSADLAESNNTTMEGEPSFIPKGKQTREWKGGPYGRTLHFGIRENGMGMILNGIALEGLTRPYGGTFLVFSDYMRPAVRLAAIQQVPVTYVWTHDSIGLGEDGPTHQPIEHLAALRAIPGLDVVRPADANETAAAWAEILRRGTPRRRWPCRARTCPIVDRNEHGKATRRRQGRLRARRRGVRRPRRRPRRDRLRGAAGRRGPPAPREGRHRHPRRLDAVPGMVREADALLPGQGAAAGRPRPRQRRGGRVDGLARPRRRRRALRQHRALRRLGGCRNPVPRVRLHRRGGRQGRQGLPHGGPQGRGRSRPSTTPRRGPARTPAPTSGTTERAKPQERGHGREVSA